MKNYQTKKPLFYKVVVLEEDGGFHIIRIRKPILQALSALHLLLVSAYRTPVRAFA